MEVKNQTSKNERENSRSQEIGFHPSTFSAHTTNRILQGVQGIQELQEIQELQRVKELQQIQEQNSHNLKAYLASKGAAAVEQLRD